MLSTIVPHSGHLNQDLPWQPTLQRSDTQNAVEKDVDSRVEHSTGFVTARYHAEFQKISAPMRTRLPKGPASHNTTRLIGLRRSLWTGGILSYLARSSKSRKPSWCTCLSTSFNCEPCTLAVLKFVSFLVQARISSGAGVSTMIRAWDKCRHSLQRSPGKSCTSSCVWAPARCGEGFSFEDLRGEEDLLSKAKSQTPNAPEGRSVKLWPGRGRAVAVCKSSDHLGRLSAHGGTRDRTCNGFRAHASCQLSAVPLG